MNDGTERCPRCGRDFDCGANHAVPCRCTTVTLGAATLAALREQYVGCLCLACLRALAAGEAAALQPPPVDADRA